MVGEKLMRDSFIEEIYNAIKSKRGDIYFLNSDLGAIALDKFREDPDTKDRFIHTGIAEQNMINLATGLALRDKITYAYAMAPFLFARPFEQIKIAAAMNTPINIVGVGVGLSYQGDGPTHYCIEDIGCMKTLPNMEIITPCDSQSARETAIHSINFPALRYIRLDRMGLPEVYKEGDKSFIEEGIVEVDKGKDLCIISAGIMVHTARDVRNRLASKGLDVGVVDAYKTYPLNANRLLDIASRYDRIAVLEENFLSGGIGESVAGIFVDNGVIKPLKRIGIPSQYNLEGWVKRKNLHELLGLDAEKVASKLELFSQND